MKHIIANALLLAAVLAATAVPAAAQNHPVRHRKLAPAPVIAPQRTVPYSYYPNEIEGGVSGNLPFNNQLRKLSDPLNANGGK